MDAQRTGVALVRVSKVGGREDLLSPDLQRIAITDYAQRNQILVTEWVEVLDESASQIKSRWWTTLDRVVTQVEAKQFDAVLVWKFSRAARNRRRWAVALDRIEVAGGTLESATEGLDTRTATGRLARGMLAELNAWESEVKSEQWKEVHSYRLAQGLPGDGKPRFGYLRDGKGYVPDPVTAPFVKECYERYLRGWSGHRLALWLESEGVKTTYGNKWQSQVLLSTLDAGFAAGFLKADGQHVPGAQEPVISRRLFENYQQRRAKNKTVAPRALRGAREFTNLLKCSACGGNLSIQGKELWRCNRNRFGTCGVSTTAYEPRVRREVAEWIAAVADGTDEEFVRLQQQASRPLRNEAALRRKIVRAETRLFDLARRNLDGFYDDPTYLGLRDETVRARDEAVKLLNEHEQVPDQEPFQQAALAWPLLTEMQRREGMMLLLDRIIVTKGPCPGDNLNRSSYEIVPRWRM